MAIVRFYEKPGCANNTRQKQLLIQAGHHVDASSLLTEPWSADRLREFFGSRPILEWFNPAAPRIKSGEIQPASLTADQAIEAMLAEPLLIRRPLMEVDGQRMIGFDQTQVDAWIGLSPQADLSQDVQSCRMKDEKCPPPKA